MAFRSFMIPGTPQMARYFVVNGRASSDRQQDRVYNAEFGPYEDPLDGYEPISVVGGIYATYTSPSLNTLSGRVVGPDLIYFKNKSHVRPVKPLYKLPKRKPLVKPRIVLYSPRTFGFRRRLPNESPSAYQELRGRAEIAFLIQEATRMIRLKRASARILKNYEEKVKRREAFIARYDKVYARRIAKYNRRLALFERRRNLLLQVRNKTPAKRNTFHEHSRVLLKGVNLVPCILSVTSWDGTPTLENWDGSWWLYSTDGIMLGTAPLLSEQHLAGDWASRAFPYDLLHAMRLRVKSRMVDKLKKQEFHAGNALAQYRQTLELLQALLKGLRSGISLKSAVKELSTLLKSPRRVADNTLAYTFGVEPLVADLKALFNLLVVDGLPALSGKVSVRSSVTTNYRGLISVGPLTFMADGRLTVRRVYHYDVENALYVLLNRFGLLNPGEIIWEIMPWSFVVDWFANVGERISSLTDEAGLIRRDDCSETISFRGIVTDMPSQVDNRSVPLLDRSIAEQLRLNALGQGWPAVEVPAFLGTSLGGTIHLKQRVLAADESPLRSLAEVPQFGFRRIAETAALTTQLLTRFRNVF